MLSSSNPTFFKANRLNDYRKQQNADQPLTKEAKRFSAIKAPCYGATNSLGPYQLESKKISPLKIYYLAPHPLSEYFALEVLLELGLMTPKVRIVTAHPSFSPLCHDEKQPDYYIATKGLDDYIPMLAVRHDLPLKQHEDDLSPLRKQYQIDIAKQVIFDHATKQSLKISGPLFASHLLASLINDRDFGANYLNLGLVRQGQRFFAAAIDKERAKFDGCSYAKAYKPKSPLFTSSTKEQQLAVVVAIQQSLLADESGQCAFERVFYYSRVKATQALASKAAAYWDAFKLSAQSLVDFFQAQEGNNLQTFAVREKLRSWIAAQVLQQLNLSKDIPSHVAKQMIAHIIEDLRGPYYQTYFFDIKQGEISSADVDNGELISAISKAMVQEWQLDAPTKHDSSLVENPKSEIIYRQAP